MKEGYWSDVRKLSAIASNAGQALDEFLKRVPAPDSVEELAEYDEVRNAADDAFHAWSTYCQNNR